MEYARCVSLARHTALLRAVLADARGGAVGDETPRNIEPTEGFAKITGEGFVVSMTGEGFVVSIVVAWGVAPPTTTGRLLPPATQLPSEMERSYLPQQMRDPDYFIDAIFHNLGFARSPSILQISSWSLDAAVMRL